MTGTLPPRRRETRADQAAVRERGLARLRDLVWQTIGERPARVWLVGSMARGDWVKSSDIDLAIALDTPDRVAVLGRLALAIEESPIPYFVDLVDLAETDEDFRARLLSEGIEWQRP
ncbi:MAG: nucleotidyltransferase domain-containing protein [Azospirillaceae bacterium]